MKLRTAVVSIVLLLGSAASLVNAAESKAVQTMAGILLHLQHYPTDADKQSLKQIAEDESATQDERTVAQALINVRHTAATADKAKLEAIVKERQGFHPGEDARGDRSQTEPHALRERQGKAEGLDFVM